MSRFIVILISVLGCCSAMANDDWKQMTLEEWMALSAPEQGKIASGWSPYVPQNADSLPNQIVEEFRQQHPQLDFRGLGNVHGSLELVVLRPFIFDKQLIPNSFLGMSVRVSLSEPLPDGFEVFSGYLWAPENYANFVDSRADDIRDALDDQSMTRDEMLHALIGMPFDEWIKICRSFGDEYTDL